MTKKNQPLIRFKGYEEAWEQREFKKFFDFPVSTNSLSRALLNYENGNIKSVHYGDILVKYSSILNVKTDLIPYITDGVLEQYKSNLLKNGDIIFADAAEDETVGKAVEVSDIADENLVAGLHTIVARPKEKVAEYFLGYYINSVIYHKQLLRLMQGSKVSSISKGNLQVTDVSFPKDIEEQNKIGNFFKQLDETITLQERELELLKVQKKGFLQRLFPKKMQISPDIRFKHFREAWKQRKFEDMYNIMSGFAFKLSDYSDSGVPIVNGESINHGEVSSNNWNHLPEKFRIEYRAFLLKKEDIVLGLNRPITNGNLKIAQIPSFLDNSLLYQRAGKVEIISETDLNFSYHLLNREIYKFVLKEAQGSDQPFISTTKLKKWSYFFPKQEREQTKIGIFFKQLDETITLQEKELEKLKQLKKAFLQKMFV